MVGDKSKRYDQRGMILGGFMHESCLNMNRL